ncbi:hypothetical protein E1B28_002169 [Marasmius oreades]|uniref:Uncharacterized protein n=1 Tax=Marasmius oreades TaxID=181124 RepID=A0A9P7RMH7_9AGAR|nr:uncharacterized protein E1B28_002169 [Marasmius oreades]KAG7086205.1 hypothetical protein E1B28_002169 [Marasmius oreades]
MFGPEQIQHNGRHKLIVDPSRLLVPTGNGVFWWTPGWIERLNRPQRKISQGKLKSSDITS